MTTDLDLLQKRVNEARKNFLDASEACERDDALGKEIASNYLKRFLDDDPKRAEIAKEHAREANELLDRFGSNQASIANKVSLVAIKVQSAVTSLTLHFMRSASKGGKLPDAAALPTDPTLAAIAAARAFTEGSKVAIDTARDEVFANAEEMGKHLVNVMTLATVAILMRHATLLKFRREKLDVGWSDIGSRAAEQLKEQTKDELIQRSWDLTLEVLAEIAGEVISDLSPLHKVPKYVKILAKIVGVKKADTKPGGTDDMLMLLGELRKESTLISGINDAYEHAMDEIDRLAKIAE
jgi:hypothetical protein